MPVDFSDVMSQLPPELRNALAQGQFSKLAAEVYRVPTHSEHSVYAAIGTNMFMRRKEAALIRHGLRAMSGL